MSVPATPGPDPVSAGSEDGAEAGLESSPSIARVLSIQDPASAPDGVSITSRLRRLTQDEYLRTVSALLGIDARGATAEFPEELSTLDGYFEVGALGVGERLQAELAASAEDLAARAVADPAAYAAHARAST